MLGGSYTVVQGSKLTLRRKQAIRTGRSLYKQVQPVHGEVVIASEIVTQLETVIGKTACISYPIAPHVFGMEAELNEYGDTVFIK